MSFNMNMPAGGKKLGHTRAILKLMRLEITMTWLFINSKNATQLEAFVSPGENKKLKWSEWSMKAAHWNKTAE